MSPDEDAGELVAVALTRIEEEDLARAYREVPALRRLLWTPIVILGLAAPVGLVLFAVLGERPGAGICFAGFWLIFVAALAFLRARVPRTQWRSMPEHTRQCRYEAREHRFRTRTERSTVDLAYEEFYGSFETPSAFYLEQHPNYFIIVPKPAFESSAAVRAASELFARKIAGRPRRSGLAGLLTTTRVVVALGLWAALAGMLWAVHSLMRQ